MTEETRRQLESQLTTIQNAISQIEARRNELANNSNTNNANTNNPNNNNGDSGDILNDFMGRLDDVTRFAESSNDADVVDKLSGYTSTAVRSFNLLNPNATNPANQTNQADRTKTDEAMAAAIKQYSDSVASLIAAKTKQTKVEGKIARQVSKEQIKLLKEQIQLLKTQIRNAANNGSNSGVTTLLINAIKGFNNVVKSGLSGIAKGIGYVGKGVGKFVGDKIKEHRDEKKKSDTFDENFDIANVQLKPILFNFIKKITTKDASGNLPDDNTITQLIDETRNTLSRTRFAPNGQLTQSNTNGNKAFDKLWNTLKENIKRNNLEEPQNKIFDETNKAVIQYINAFKNDIPGEKAKILQLMGEKNNPTPNNQNNPPQPNQNNQENLFSRKFDNTTGYIKSIFNETINKMITFDDSGSFGKDDADYKKRMQELLHNAIATINSATFERHGSTLTESMDIVIVDDIYQEGIIDTFQNVGSFLNQDVGNVYQTAKTNVGNKFDTLKHRGEIKGYQDAIQNNTVSNKLWDDIKNEIKQKTQPNATDKEIFDLTRETVKKYFGNLASDPVRYRNDFFAMLNIDPNFQQGLTQRRTEREDQLNKKLNPPQPNPTPNNQNTQDQAAINMGLDLYKQYLDKFKQELLKDGDLRKQKDLITTFKNQLTTAINEYDVIEIIDDIYQEGITDLLNRGAHVLSERKKAKQAGNLDAFKSRKDNVGYNAIDQLAMKEKDLPSMIDAKLRFRPDPSVDPNTFVKNYILGELLPGLLDQVLSKIDQSISQNDQNNQNNPPQPNPTPTPNNQNNPPQPNDQNNSNGTPPTPAPAPPTPDQQPTPTDQNSQNNPPAPNNQNNPPQPTPPDQQTNPNDQNGTNQPTPQSDQQQNQPQKNRQTYDNIKNTITNQISNVKNQILDGFKNAVTITDKINVLENISSSIAPNKSNSNDQSQQSVTNNNQSENDRSIGTEYDVIEIVDDIYQEGLISRIKGLVGKNPSTGGNSDNADGGDKKSTISEAGRLIQKIVDDYKKTINTKFGLSNTAITEKRIDQLFDEINVNGLTTKFYDQNVFNTEKIINNVNETEIKPVLDAIIDSLRNEANDAESSENLRLFYKKYKYIVNTVIPQYNKLIQSINAANRNNVISSGSNYYFIDFERHINDVIEKAMENRSTPEGYKELGRLHQYMEDWMRHVKLDAGIM